MTAALTVPHHVFLALGQPRPRPRRRGLSRPPVRPALTVAVVLLLLASRATLAAPPARAPGPPTQSLLGGEGPPRVSALELLGRVGMALVLVYGVGFGLSRCRGLKLGQRSWPHLNGMSSSRRLQVCETVPLPRSMVTLHLLELDGRALLVGVSGQQITALSPLAVAQDTSSFSPVAAPPPLVTQGPARRYEVLEPVTPPRAAIPTAKAEAEWAQERKRLITALMQPE